MTRVRHLNSLKSPVALLYQAIEPPIIDGIRKPMKPGGYSDSCADIAFALRAAGVPVVTPVENPDSRVNLDWSFPDTEKGIADALLAGAEVLWANTILFEGHPIHGILDRVWIVGPIPELMQKYDDKFDTNALLRREGLPVAPSVLLSLHGDKDTLSLATLTEKQLHQSGFAFPIVLKPVRGRGSQGVTLVQTLTELKTMAAQLLTMTEKVGDSQVLLYGDVLMLEPFLQGEEVTITVMPAGTYTVEGREVVHERPWALPAVRRFNHHDGIAPYNGTVSVTKNSVVIPEWNEALRTAADACGRVAEITNAVSPMRIDCRQNSDGVYVLFDVNIKPNMTGKGRPGRDDQDSLCAMAAAAIGWSYTDLLLNMLRQAWKKE